MSDPLLNESIVQQLKSIFNEMIHPVDILFFGSQDNAEVTEFSRKLLQEVGALTPAIHISLHDMAADAVLAQQYRVDKAPGFVILGRQADGSRVDYGIRYAGFPGNYEFNSLVNDIMLVSRRESSLKPETRAGLAGLKKPVHLMVFVTPT